METLPARTRASRLRADAAENRRRILAAAQEVFTDIGLDDLNPVRLATLRSSVSASVPERAARSVDEHEALIDLIADGVGGERVERACREHRTRTLDGVLAHEGWRSCAPPPTPPDPGHGPRRAAGTTAIPSRRR